MTKLALIPSEAEQKKIGRQIEDLHRKSTLGLLDCVAMGDLVAQVRKVVSTVETTSQKATRGPQTKGDGIKGWLEAYTSGVVPLSTAYRYEELAENVRAELKIGQKVNLAKVITGEIKDGGAVKLLAKVSDFVAGKSQRQLLIGIGKPDAQIGGKRSARTKPSTEAERREAWLEDARQRSLSTFSGLHDLEERWKTLDDAKLKIALEDARAFVREAEAYLKTPPPARAGLDVEKLMRAAEAADQGGTKS